MAETKRFDPEQAEALFREVRMVPAQKCWFAKGMPPCGCLTTACAMKADPKAARKALTLEGDMNTPLSAEVGAVAGFSAPYSRGLVLGWDGFDEPIADQWSKLGPAQYGGPEVMLGYEDGKRAWEVVQAARQPKGGADDPR
jgi:hypothetical protein